MSKIADELISCIKNHPELWVRNSDNGIYCWTLNVSLTNCGNGSKYIGFWMSSIIEIVSHKNNTKIGILDLSWRDKYRLEEVYLWWLRNSNLEMLSK